MKYLYCKHEKQHIYIYIIYHKRTGVSFSPHIKQPYVVPEPWKCWLAAFQVFYVLQEKLHITGLTP
jgi:hypothetical protein